jgi:preprotein translocase subunit SecD
MVIRAMRFNSYLLLLVCGLCGCETTSPKSDKATARITVTVESNREAPGRSESITVSRAQPITLTIQSSALLNETHVAEARLMDSFAGFTLLIQFTEMGTHLLEQFTAQYQGRRFAIAVQFGEKEMQTRWLAAPVIKRRITDGILAFTPDASREEAELIVRGLNNTAIQLGNQKKQKNKAASAGS